jgi:16S rRNA (cytosine1402-N4)-methyltransferase
VEASTHVPVMTAEVLEIITPALAVARPVLVDCTLGLGGHSELLLSKFENLKIIGFDQDQEALIHAQNRLAKYQDRIVFIKNNFTSLKIELSKLNINSVNAIFFDLGVSSLQLDKKDRGFSYLSENELDMRMDTTSSFSAKDLINTWEEKDISYALFTFGEEKFARKIAANIVKSRANRPISTTKELVGIIEKSIPAPARRSGGNPSKKTFQAIRIAVNQELTVLAEALPQAADLLAPGGRIVVLTYHSLEDRIVKQFFKSKTEIEKLPREIPVMNEATALFKSPSNKPIRPSAEEISKNSRSKSAKLRVLEKLAVAA